MRLDIVEEAHRHDRVEPLGRCEAQNVALDEVTTAPDGGRVSQRSRHGQHPGREIEPDDPRSAAPRQFDAIAARAAACVEDRLARDRLQPVEREGEPIVDIAPGKSIPGAARSILAARIDAVEIRRFGIEQAGHQFGRVHAPTASEMVPKRNVRQSRSNFAAEPASA